MYRVGITCVMYRVGITCVMYRVGITCVMYRVGITCVMYRVGITRVMYRVGITRVMYRVGVTCDMYRVGITCVIICTQDSVYDRQVSQKYVVARLRLIKSILVLEHEQLVLRLFTSVKPLLTSLGFSVIKSIILATNLN